MSGGIDANAGLVPAFAVPDPENKRLDITGKDSKGYKLCICNTRMPIEITYGDVVIIKAADTCAWQGRYDTHKQAGAMCMPCRLAPLATGVYEAARARQAGFTIQTKDEPDGPFTYVKMDLMLVDWQT